MGTQSSLGDCSENGAGPHFIVQWHADADPCGVGSDSTRVGVWVFCLVFLLVFVTSTHAETLTVRTGETEIRSASAVASGSKTQAKGKIDKREVVFDKLLPGESYDLTFTQPDNTQLRLVDLSWYADLPPATDAPGPLTDEDKAAVAEILSGIKAFTNKNAILALAGDAERAVALVELIRDTDFHARKGDEIIWRIEVWYFEFQAGGWAKVQQQNRIVERERFKSTDAFEAHRKPLKWIGIEKGLRIQKGQDQTLDLKTRMPNDQ